MDLVINIPKNYHETELRKDHRIAGSPWISVFLLTNIQLANRFAEALSRKGMGAPDQGSAANIEARSRNAVAEEAEQ